MTQAKPSRPRSRIAGLSVWLTILGLAMLFLPLTLLSRSIREAEAAAQTELDLLQANLASTPPVPDNLASLVQMRLERLTDAQALGSARDELMAIHVNFPAVTAVLLNYRPELMMLTQVLQNEMPQEGTVNAGWLLVGGEAHFEAQVMDYVAYLRATEVFERVDVQSIALQSVVPGTLPADRALQATQNAGVITLPHFERGLQWVTFTLRLTLTSGGS